MRILKLNPILRLLNSYMVDSPQPANISYLWNFGSLLGTCLVIQILTGIFLAMHYQPNVELAFDSVEHIMRDVNMGWAIRYTHANVASFFFIFVYAHIARGLYYGSYKSPRVAPWSIGVVILVLMIATAFLGLTNLALNDIVLTDPSYFTQYINLCSIGPLICSKRLSLILQYRGIKPLAVWENLTKPNIKKEIFPIIKPISGIYMIVNLATDEIYVGCAIPNQMQNRFNKHFFEGTGSKPVWNAIQKDGLNNFAFLVVEEFSNYTKNKHKELLNLEKNYIKNYGNYNIVGNTEKTKLAMRTNKSKAQNKVLINSTKSNFIWINNVWWYIIYLIILFLFLSK